MDTKHQPETDLGVSFIDTMKSDEVTDVISGIVEAVIDGELKDGLLKDIPIISTIVGIGKLAIDVRDYFLVKKVLRFLLELKDITRDERNAFFMELEENISYKRKIGDTLIMLLDRFDNLDKAEMAAKILKSRIRKEIDEKTLRWYVNIVERMLMQDLNDFLLYMTNETEISTKIQPFDAHALPERFHQVGLSTMEMNLEISTSGVITQDELQVLVNRGKLFRYKFTKDAYQFAKIQLGNNLKKEFSQYV